MQEQYVRTRVVLNGIRDACCQEGISRERLYLANSQELIKLFKELKMLDKYPVLMGVEPEFPTMEFPSNS
jgi:hypothetical protein